jgi:antitoxin component YwqK of YwqJK toxin-antitoxin module
MKYFFVVVVLSICIGCNRNDELGEGITREVTKENYEGIANVRREEYKRELLPIKSLGFYESGNILYQTYYMPIDSFMMVTTRTFYPSGAMQSMSLWQAKIDTFTNTSIEGKVTRSIKFYRDYYIYLLQFYPNGKIEERFGLNNFDTARVIEHWYNSGIKQSENVYKYSWSDTIKSVAWDSLGHQIRNENEVGLKFQKKGAP